MQMQTPTMNAYGVTFPCIPGVVIGFNDSIAFGFTNAGRDVMDYYRIKFKDASRTEYWYNNNWTSSNMKLEEIKIRGEDSYIDSVAYTAFGPVIYDRNFTAGDSNTNLALAMKWAAHDPSNEELTWIKLNRAKNYEDYEDAISNFSCPGQNMLFASKSGDIAIRQQGSFPARWKNQGLYIMPGEDETYAWQGMIPAKENPHIKNPQDRFIQSANQRAVDSSYPYFIPGDYFVPRGRSIYRQLSQMENITPEDMMKLQLDDYSSLAADAVPLFMKYIQTANLSAKEMEMLDEVRNWDFHYKADSKAATIYQSWIEHLDSAIWKDEFAKVEKPVEMPDEQTMIEILLRDSSFRFVDNINTTQKEDLTQQVTVSFRNTVKDLLKDETKLTWWKHKNTSVLHLLRESVLPLGSPGLETGGWKTAINALSATNGPSWRMIVHLTTPTEAYGVYPGGQSGNPGSRFYDSFLETWRTGKYFRLWMMQSSEAGDKRIIGKISFTNS
jgi:penicillin amidase